MKSTLLQLRIILALTLALPFGLAHAQAVQNAVNQFLKKRTDAFMTITGYSLTPDVTTGSLSIKDKAGGNPNLQMISLGGGDRISKDFPLYLEGTVAVNRYNPTIVGNVLGVSVDLPVHWNGITGTGGIGWDFPLTDNLRIRPIANVMLGHLESDLSVAGRVIQNQTGADIEFLKNGRMNAYGLGGSLMLDYEDYTPEREYDVEVRYTNIGMNTFATSSAVQGSADSQSLGLWARARVPTPLTVFEMPTRAVFEVAHTEFLGQLRGALGFNSLSSLGTGIEFDRSASEPLFSRVRLVFRYQFGQNVTGTSISLAASF